MERKGFDTLKKRKALVNIAPNHILALEWYKIIFKVITGHNLLKLIFVSKLHCLPLHRSEQLIINSITHFSSTSDPLPFPMVVWGGWHMSVPQEWRKSASCHFCKTPNPAWDSQCNSNPHLDQLAWGYNALLHNSEGLGQWTDMRQCKNGRQMSCAGQNWIG